MKTASISHVLRLAGLALIACAVPAQSHAEAPKTTAAEPHDGQHDFDFLFGKWKIQIRRLKNPLHGSNDWYEMTGTSVCRPVWNGKGNIEEGQLDGPNGHVDAMMVRLYSPTSGQWSLNWVTAKNPRFEVPTIGEFKNGRGEFYDQETIDGRSILVRMVWSNITPTSAHYEQAFSADWGKTWEPNWIADVTRLE